MRGTGIRDGVPKTLLAKALYDNHPDCSDELAFSRGDILTILEQNVPQSEGWWKCLLHGKQGLAPANRLQVLTQATADRTCPPILRNPDTDLANTEETYQVPTLLHPPPPGPVYEPMKSWVEGTLPATAHVYELPDPPSSARIVCEKTLSFPKQALFVLPRPTRVSLPTLPSQVYDVPIQSRVPLTPRWEQQPLYDVPASPQKAARQSSASQASGQRVPLTPTTAFRQGYNTLPNPQKSEWICDSPLPLGRTNARNACLTSVREEPEPSAVPSTVLTVHSPRSSRTTSLPPQPCKNMQKKTSLPEDPAYAFLVSRNTLLSNAGSSYKVPSSFLIPRVEQQNTKPNIYDIPKTMPGVPHTGNELRKAKEATENSIGHHSSWVSRQTTPLSPDLDQLSVSSSNSRASVVSSCSSTSTDSSSSSSSEDSTKEFSLDMNLAKETAMALQHKVVSSVASLLLYVSRTWRLRDSLETNISAIRRAADHTEESLREFLDFAQEVGGVTHNLTDSHLQARIRDQIQTISNSNQILLDAKRSLDSCNWSLEVLVTDKVQSNLDDLERFVMVARMVPEDVKRFASIVIANGRLLFKQNCEKEETELLVSKVELKCEKSIQLSQREIESYQKSSPASKPGANGHCAELVKKNRMNVCGLKFPNLEEKEKNILEQKSEDKKELGVTGPNSCITPSLSGQNPERKVHLSEHSRLYFGALFKAIGVFTNSLSNSQPPEVFITHSKLVIMVGQKLVDTLCKETQEKDERNEVLHSSSHLCGLLKDLALATKNAVLKYPSPTALGHLLAEAEKLEHHTRQFRGTLE